MKLSTYTGVRFLLPILGLGLLLGTLFVSEAHAQSVPYNVSFESVAAPVGSEVVVNWQAPLSRPNGGAWIGLYLAGSGDQRYEDWEYVPSTGTSGEVSLLEIPTSTVVRAVPTAAIRASKTPFSNTLIDFA